MSSFWILLELGMMQVVMKTGAVRDVQSFNQIVTFKNPTPRSLQSGCSFCRPANSVIETE